MCTNISTNFAFGFTLESEEFCPGILFFKCLPREHHSLANSCLSSSQMTGTSTLLVASLGPLVPLFPFVYILKYACQEEKFKSQAGESITDLILAFRDAFWKSFFVLLDRNSFPSVLIWCSCQRTWHWPKPTLPSFKGVLQLRSVLH